MLNPDLPDPDMVTCEVKDAVEPGHPPLDLFPLGVEDKIWCIKNPRGRWCAIEGGSHPATGVLGTYTRCGYMLTVRRGVKLRLEPTCRQCREEGHE